MEDFLFDGTRHMKNNLIKPLQQKHPGNGRVKISDNSTRLYKVTGHVINPTFYLISLEVSGLNFTWFQHFCSTNYWKLFEWGSDRNTFRQPGRPCINFNSFDSQLRPVGSTLVFCLTDDGHLCVELSVCDGPTADFRRHFKTVTETKYNYIKLLLFN